MNNVNVHTRSLSLCNIYSITCIFCNSLISFFEKDPHKFFQHLLNQHDIYLNYEMILFISLMDNDMRNETFTKYNESTNMFTSDELTEINQKSDNFLFAMKTINMTSEKVELENGIKNLTRKETSLDKVYNTNEKIEEKHAAFGNFLNQNENIDDKKCKYLPNNINILVQKGSGNEHGESLVQEGSENVHKERTNPCFITNSSKSIRHEKEFKQERDIYGEEVKINSVDFEKWTSNTNETFTKNIMNEKEIKLEPVDESYSKCDQCNILFFDKVELRSHIKINHTVKTKNKELKQIECNICGKSFKFNSLRKPKETRRSLRRHMENKHGPQKFVQCEICFKKLRDNKQTMKDHYQRIHEGSKTKKCTECDKLFYSKGEVNIHIISYHTFGIEATCDQCGQSFKTKERVDQHKKVVHYGEIFTCDICMKELKTKGTFESHYRVCSKTTNFVCSYDCKTKYFRSAGALKIHTESVHLGIKTQFCEECGKGFAVLKDLKIHKSIHHSGERPYSCSVCDKSFATSNMLKRHKDIHSDVKQFQCSLCGKGFTQKTTLTTHMRIHTGDKFTCESCGKGFVKRAFLKSHACKVP